MDAILLLLTPQAMTEIVQTAEAAVRISKQYDKPILASFMGGKEVAVGNRVLGAGRIPFYDFPEEAAAALVTMARQQEWVNTPPQQTVRVPVDRERAATAMLTAQKARRLKLNEMEARQIVAAYGIPLPQAQLATSPDQAARFAAEIGFPVVLKIISPDILHKTDMGGVVVGIKNEKQARQAYQDILIAPGGTCQMRTSGVWPCNNWPIKARRSLSA